jgi:hypothetical protein
LNETVKRKLTRRDGRRRSLLRLFNSSL